MKNENPHHIALVAFRKLGVELGDHGINWVTHDIYWVKMTTDFRDRWWYDLHEI